MTATLKKIKKNGRDRLIATSLKLFSQKGFHACSVREICDIAKANVSLISFYFGGKVGLLDAILEELTESDFNKINEVICSVNSVVDFTVRLNIFLNGYIDFSIKHADVIGLYLEELERGNKYAVEILPKTYGKIWKSLNVFLQSAQDQKIIDESLDVKILAFQILAPINHLIRSRHNPLMTSFFSFEDEKIKKKFIEQIIKTIF